MTLSALKQVDKLIWGPSPDDVCLGINILDNLNLSDELHVLVIKELLRIGIERVRYDCIYFQALTGDNSGGLVIADVIRYNQRLQPYLGTLCGPPINPEWMQWRSSRTYNHVISVADGHFIHSS